MIWGSVDKTVITLTAIQDLMYDSYEIRRVLVVAPLRVAKCTWPDEVKKWSHLKRLCVSVICGTAAERTAAVEQAPAPFLLLVAAAQ